MFKKTTYQQNVPGVPGVFDKPRISRRAFLLSSAVMAALASMNLPSLIKPAMAEGYSQADFARLSSFLTGQTTLDAISAQRFFVALAKHDPTFETKAAALLRFIDDGKFPNMDAFLAASKTRQETDSGIPSGSAAGTSPGTAAEPAAAAVKAAATTTPEMMSTATSIVSAWYLGIVGSAADAELITYESALMYMPTKGILAVPTYGPGPLAWGETPAGAVGTNNSTNNSTNSNTDAATRSGPTSPAVHTPA